ncbi:hypothetical protein OH492_20045 [Vibrio chagasii]|nr:hypothetical protein [Vibrio chagasii]
MDDVVYFFRGILGPHKCSLEAACTPESQTCLCLMAGRTAQSAETYSSVNSTNNTKAIVMIGCVTPKRTEGRIGVVGRNWRKNSRGDVVRAVSHLAAGEQTTAHVAGKTLVRPMPGNDQ